jgi:CysZ protein
MTSLAKIPPVGLVGGAGALLRGLGFVVGTPRVWPLAMVPVTVAFVLFGGLATAGIWGALRLAHGLLPDPSTTLATVGAWTVSALLSAVALTVALLVSLALAQPLSGAALERLARAQEAALGLPPWPEQPALASMARALRVTLTGLALGLPPLGLLTLVGLLAPPAALVTTPLAFVVSALMLAWDFLDYPLSVRGLSTRERLRFIGAHFWPVLGFGLAAGAILLVPGVGLLLLPVGAAGAARLVARTSGSSTTLTPRLP